MLEASTSGHGQLKHKSINVEANLLTEWLDQRAQLHEQATRTGGLLALFILLAMGTAPFLTSAHRAAVERQTIASARLERLDAELLAFQKEKEDVQPRINEQAMRAQVQRNASLFLGHLSLVLNAASSEMAVESIGVDALGAELTLRCKADAESPTVARRFIEAAGAGQQVRSSLLATSKRNARLGEDGVGFEYVKRVEVGR